MLKIEDITFFEIDSSKFEKLCFELLMRLGFKEVKWRGGINDQGRDIEAKYNISNPLLGDTSETWHFECKKYKAAVGKSEFLDKIAWADSNKPDKLVFFISSHVTNQTRFWIDNINQSKFYEIKVIEGHELKRILLDFPDLVKLYLTRGDYSFLVDQMKSWLLYDGEMATSVIKNFLNYLDMEKLSDSELLFLFTSSLFAKNRIFEHDEGVDEFDFTHIIKELKKRIGKLTRKIFPFKDKLLTVKWANDYFQANGNYYYYDINELLLPNYEPMIHCVIGENGDWWGLPRDQSLKDKGIEFVLYKNSNFTSLMRIVPKKSFEYRSKLPITRDFKELLNK